MYDTTQAMPPALTQALPVRQNPPTVGVPLALTSFWATLANQKAAPTRDLAARTGSLPRLLQEYQANAEAAYQAALPVLDTMPECAAIRPTVTQAMAEHRKRLERDIKAATKAVIAAADAPRLAIAADAAAAARGELPPAAPVNAAEPLSAAPVIAAEPQPAAPVNAAKPLPDGPLGNLRFRWHGRECPAMPKPAYVLVQHLWHAADRSGDYDDARDAVHPDGYDGKGPALANACKFANRYFLTHNIDLELTYSRVAGRVAIVPMVLQTIESDTGTK